MAIAKGLTSKLDNCIATAISIDTTNPGAQTPNPAPTPDACSIVTVIITYDEYPEENTWTLTGPGGEIASGIGAEFGPSSVSAASFCLVHGDYTFTIDDWGLDGICCACGFESYTIRSDTFIIDDTFEGSEETEYFTI